ncbi:uncharacterized protein [Setaria viridis]
MEEVDMVHAVARHGSSPPFGRRRQMRQQHHVEKFLARIVFDEMLTREIESWNIHRPVFSDKNPQTVCEITTKLCYVLLETITSSPFSYIYICTGRFKTLRVMHNLSTLSRFFQVSFLQVLILLILRHHWLWWGCNLHLMDNQQVQGASLVSFASILKMFDKMPQLTSAASKARRMIIHFLVFFTLVPPFNRAALSICVLLTAAGHGTRRKRWLL